MYWVPLFKNSTYYFPPKYSISFVVRTKILLFVFMMKTTNGCHGKTSKMNIAPFPLKWLTINQPNTIILFNLYIEGQKMFERIIFSQNLFWHSSQQSPRHIANCWQRAGEKLELLRKNLWSIANDCFDSTSLFGYQQTIWEIWSVKFYSFLRNRRNWTELLIKIIFFAGTYLMPRHGWNGNCIDCTSKPPRPNNELASIKRCEIVPSGSENYGEPRAG
jgi:hypothetical protein